VIVLISKPPAPQVAEKVLEAAANGEKPVVVNFVGTDTSTWQQRYAGKVAFAYTLTEAAWMADALCSNPALPGQVSPLPEMDASPLQTSAVLQNRHQPPYLAALFAGGTFCEEALHLWGKRLGPVYSNVPLDPAWLWRGEQRSLGHYALDLGDDEYTRGRPHPLIDPQVRLNYLRAAASNPQVGVILLDIVLGYCAHANPAAIYAPFIRESVQQAEQSGRHLRYVISLCGTEDDPQRFSRQATHLREAGAEVYTSNAEAAARCLALLAGSLS
jgi:FdrA protein